MQTLTKEQIFSITPESLSKYSLYHKVEKFLENRGTTIQRLAEQYEYPEDSRYLLNFDWKLLFEKCPNEFKSLYTPKRRQDTRNEVEFSFDILCGELLEERVIRMFNQSAEHEQKELRLIVTGKDKKRQILMSSDDDEYKNIDTVVVDSITKKAKLRLEIQHSFSDSKYTSVKIPLRWKKYPTLRSVKGALLFIRLDTETKNSQFVLIDVLKHHRIEESENVFHKKGCELYLNEDEKFMLFNSNNLYMKLKDLIESRKNDTRL